MTGATHMAVAVSVGMIIGVPNTSLALLAGGAVLPDLDTSRSTIGRILFPISIPLGKWLGHRGAFHSFWLWSLVMVMGIFWAPLTVIGAGAILHIFADCYTISGVKAMSPWSNVVFVFFKRSWRIKTGSNAEFAILLVIGSLVYASHQITVMGGISALIGTLTGSPKIMQEQYIGKGLKICFAEGKFRWANGNITEERWQIIGTEGSSGMAFVFGEKIIRTPKDGKFLRAFLKPSDEFYESMNVRGWYKTESLCFFMSGGKWFRAEPGDLVYGNVIGKGLIVNEKDESLYTIDVKLH